MKSYQFHVGPSGLRILSSDLIHGLTAMAITLRAFGAFVSGAPKGERAERPVDHPTLSHYPFASDPDGMSEFTGYGFLPLPLPLPLPPPP